jgi:hypothetical protein
MNNKEEMIEILENYFFPVTNEDNTYIDTNNGILNNELVERRKRVFLKESMYYLVEELVNTVQDYPEDNLSKVTFSTDFMVVKRSDFEKLVSLLEDGDEA